MQRHATSRPPAAPTLRSAALPQFMNHPPRDPHTAAHSLSALMPRAVRQLPACIHRAPARARIVGPHPHLQGRDESMACLTRMCPGTLLAQGRCSGALLVSKH